MSETTPTPARIDRRLVGAPIQIDGRIVQPVARLRGRLGSGGDRKGGGAAGQFCLEPVEVIVRQADGGEATVALRDPTAEALQGIMRAAAAVTLLSVALSVLARLLRRGR
ncbi:MAG TPA: hypothetical protein PKM78_16230 [Anaerolineae bacterium]|nr:hypothetical protein [Anaerolineae bacterium]HNU05652.1 hypothetical protein [Anaerolineae bacterium]